MDQRRRRVYAQTAFQIVRGIFLLVSVFFVLWSVLALLDLVFRFNWGFTWPMPVIGIGAAVAAFGGNLFIKRLFRLYADVRLEK